MNRIQLLLIVTILVAGPLAFGAVHSPAWATLLLLVGLAALCGDRRPLPVGGRWMILCGGILVGCVAVSLLPVPGTVLGALSPISYQLQQPTRALGGEVAPFTTSIEPHTTWAYLLGVLGAWGLCAVILGRDWDRGAVLTVVGAVFVTATGIAVYGLYQVHFDSPLIYGLRKRFYWSQATGTYINKNHFAGLMELGIPMGVVLLALPARMERLTAGPQLRRFISGLGILLMSAALVASRSRMGLLSLSVGLLGMVVMAFFTRRSGLYFLLFVLCLVPLVSINIVTGFGPVRKALGVFEKEERSANERLAVWGASLRLVSENPYLGVGAGNWGTAFSRVHPPKLPNGYDEAHNDYLQLLVEFGAVGLLAVLAGIVFWFRQMIRLAQDLPPPERLIAIGLVGGTLSLLVHSLADFNMQIPANRYLLVALTSLGLCLRGEQKSTARRGGGQLFLGVLAVLLIWQGCSVLLAARHRPYLPRDSSVLTDRVRFLESLGTQDGAARQHSLSRAVEGARGVLSRDPGNPAWQHELGLLYGMMAATPLDQTQIESLRKQQGVCFRRAVQYAPMNCRYRYSYGLDLRRKGQWAQADRQVVVALRLGQSSAELQYRCAQYFITRYQSTRNPVQKELVLQALRSCAGIGTLEDLHRAISLLWSFLPEVRYLERILLPDDVIHGLSFLTRLGKLDGALELIKIDPEWRNRPGSLLEAGKLYWLLGQPDQSWEMWRLTVVLTSSPRRTWDQLETFLRHYRGAWLRFLAHIAAQRAAPAEVYHRLAMEAKRSDKLRLARRYIDMAIRARPKELRYLELRDLLD